MTKRLSRYVGLTALLAAVTLGAEAQPLTGGLLGRGGTASYARMPAPPGCSASSVPIFLGSPVALGCDAGLTYDAGTDTLTVGAAPVADGYSTPVAWSAGSKYYLTGGRATFSGTQDNVGGIGYNSLASPVAGDVQFVLGFESDYNNGTNRDTEWYYAWNGPIGVAKEVATGNTRAGRDRRPLGFNTSLGTAAGNPATRPIGYTEAYFDVDNFSVGGTAAWSKDFSLDMTTSQARSAAWLMRWYGSADFAYGLTLGGNLTVNGAGANNLAGSSTVLTAGTSTYNFSGGSSALIGVSNGVNDTGASFKRGTAAEYLNIGAAAGGSIFGGASNAFYIDAVSASAGALRPTIFRSSLDSGANFVDSVRIDPANAVVTLPFTTESTSETAGALVVGGGLAVAKKGIFGGSIRSIQPAAEGGGVAHATVASSGGISTITLNSTAAGGFKYVDFSYGATPTSQWKFGFSGWYPAGWIGFNEQLSGGGIMVTPNRNLLVTALQTDMAGTYGLRLDGTTAATSTTTGSLINGGGFGNAGAAWIGGALNVASSATATQYRLSALNTAPASAAATGTLGEIRITADSIYVCIATDTWVKAALATW